ncbi:MAG: hypothetical protein IPK85_23925 [Gemmatimonadetes bacterium]|nr:hypothetical protein [Gemmatimonadota bacterium]
MHRSLLLLATTAGLATEAQTQGRELFGMFSVGPALPMGTFADDFGAGWSVSAGVGRALANRNVELRGTATYGSFGVSSELGGGSGTSTPFAMTADLLYRIGKADAQLRPYLVGGAGLSSVGYSSEYSYEPGGGGSSYSERDNGMTVGAGGGVIAQRGRTGFFAEARYAIVTGSDHSHLPITVGVRIGAR